MRSCVVQLSSAFGKDYIRDTMLNNNPGTNQKVGSWTELRIYLLNVIDAHSLLSSPTPRRSVKKSLQVLRKIGRLMIIEVSRCS